MQACRPTFLAALTVSEQRVYANEAYKVSERYANEMACTYRHLDLAVGHSVVGSSVPGSPGQGKHIVSYVHFLDASLTTGKFDIAGP